MGFQQQIFALGSMRSVAQIVSYEIPTALVILTICYD
jgi:NADH:ubiquinone oxidoreductase subunit H